MHVDVVDDRQHIRRVDLAAVVHIERNSEIVPAFVVIDRRERDGLSVHGGEVVIGLGLAIAADAGMRVATPFAFTFPR